MLGSNKNGFTLIEILIVVAIIGLMTAVVVPNFSKLLPRRERQVFLGKLNALTRFAWHRALVERKTQQVEFDFKKNIVSVSDVVRFKDNGPPETAPIKGAYLNTSLAIPSNIEIKNFIIEGFDEKARSTSEKTIASYFFIVPDGLTQNVTINFIDKKQKNTAGKPRQFGLVLNPFTAQFTVYDSFQK